MVAATPNCPALEVVNNQLNRWPGRLPLRVKPNVLVNGVSVPVVHLESAKERDVFLADLYTQFNGEFYRSRLPIYAIEWSTRFRNLGGSIHYDRQLVRLSAAHHESCGIVAMGIVLAHELIHLSLHHDNLPSGHTGDFKARSKAIGLPGIYHQMPLPERFTKPKSAHRYLYYCPCCREAIFRSVRLSKKTPPACRKCCNKFNSGQWDQKFTYQYNCEVEFFTD